MKTRYVLWLAAALLVAPISFAQPNLTAPRASQHAFVMQTAGLTEISVDYHRPGVNNRPIWGALVPYDAVWRGGANENTIFQVSSDVTVNGEALPAGRYGLHMIPTTGSWTIIFSKMADAWGSFSYDETEDALRVTASPRPRSHEERLSYRFEQPTNTSTEMVMAWEELEVPLSIEVNTTDVVLANMLVELRGLPRFSWNGWNQIAAFALQNNVRLDDALGWVDQSMQTATNGANTLTKMGVLNALGSTTEADAMEDQFYAIANENEMNTYGYQLLFGGRQQESIPVFRKNVADHSDSWNVHDSLGEGLAAIGEIGEAIEHYEHARGMAPQAQHARIDGVLTQLRASN